MQDKTKASKASREFLEKTDARTIKRHERIKLLIRELVHGRLDRILDSEFEKGMLREDLENPYEKAEQLYKNIFAQ